LAGLSGEFEDSVAAIAMDVVQVEKGCDITDAGFHPFVVFDVGETSLGPAEAGGDLFDRQAGLFAEADEFLAEAAQADG